MRRALSFGLAALLLAIAGWLLGIGGNAAWQFLMFGLICGGCGAIIGWFAWVDQPLPFMLKAIAALLILATIAFLIAAFYALSRIH